MAIPTGSEWTAAPSVGYPDAFILCTPGVVSAGIWTWNRYGAALEIWLKPSVPMTATARKARGVASAVISAVWPGAKTVPLGPASKVAGPIHSAHRPGQRARAWKPRSLSGVNYFSRRRQERMPLRTGPSAHPVPPSRTSANNLFPESSCVCRALPSLPPCQPRYAPLGGTSTLPWCNQMRTDRPTSNFVTFFRTPVARVPRPPGLARGHSAPHPAGSRRPALLRSYSRD